MGPFCYLCTLFGKKKNKQAREKKVFGERGCNILTQLVIKSFLPDPHHNRKFQLKFQAQLEITIVMQCNKVLLLFLLLLKVLHLSWTIKTNTLYTESEVTIVLNKDVYELFCKDLY